MPCIFLYSSRTENPLPETGRGCNQRFFSLRLQNDTQGVILNDVKDLF